MIISSVDLNQFRYLDALATERHFGRAAERCHVSQPALSSAIRRLEAELGLRLVDRTQRFERLTDEGEVLLRRARDTLAAADAVVAEAAALRGDLSGVLRVGVIPTAAAIVGPLVAAFTGAHDATTVRLRTGRADAIVGAVLQRDLDAGVVYVDGDLDARIRVQPLMTDELVLLTSDPVLATSTEPLRWRELDDVPLALLEPTMQNRQLIDRTLERAGASPRVRVEVDGVPALVAVGLAGGSCVVSRTWLEGRVLPSGAVVRSLVSPVVAPTLALVTLAGPTATPRGRALAALVPSPAR